MFYVHKQVETQAKRTTFCRQYFQLYFLEWKFSISQRVPKGPSDIKPPVIRAMVWHRASDSHYTDLWRQYTTTNRPISQIPQCIRLISHNAPYFSRNVHMCTHFCHKMVYRGIWDWCIVGYRTSALWDCDKPWAIMSPFFVIISSGNASQHAQWWASNDQLPIWPGTVKWVQRINIYRNN